MTNLKATTLALAAAAALGLSLAAAPASAKPGGFHSGGGFKTGGFHGGGGGAFKGGGFHGGFKGGHNKLWVGHGKWGHGHGWGWRHRYGYGFYGAPLLVAASYGEDCYLVKRKVFVPGYGIVIKRQQVCE